jgi:hypothetical protein
MEKHDASIIWDILMREAIIQCHSAIIVNSRLVFQENIKEWFVMVVLNHEATRSNGEE